MTDERIDTVEGYMTSKQAAEYLHRSDSTIRKQCKAGKFPKAVKAGNTWLIPKNSVIRYSPGIITRIQEEITNTKEKI